MCKDMVGMHLCLNAPVAMHLLSSRNAPTTWSQCTNHLAMLHFWSECIHKLTITQKWDNFISCSKLYLYYILHRLYLLYYYLHDNNRCLMKLARQVR